MKKILTLGYYIVFIARLWIFDRHFQSFVAENSILLGLLVGLLLAFLFMLIFKMLTRIALLLVLVAALVAFLFAVGYFVIPQWVYTLQELIPVIRMLLNI